MGKWWFSAGGEAGDRTMEQQLAGLDELWPEVVGRSVLDVGCAEGMLSIEARRRGAREVVGLEVREDAVRRAKALAANKRVAGVTFIHHNAENLIVLPRFDVVLMLAVLHKLRDPAEALRRYAAAADRLLVLRLRHCDWPVLRDDRSGGVDFDLQAVLSLAGWRLRHHARGPVADGKPAEWVGYFSRCQA